MEDEACPNTYNTNIYLYIQKKECIIFTKISKFCRVLVQGYMHGKIESFAKSILWIDHLNIYTLLAVTTSSGRLFQTPTILDEKKYFALLHQLTGSTKFKEWPRKAEFGENAKNFKIKSNKTMNNVVTQQIICQWHVIDGTLDYQRHSKCCYKATELHQSHPGLVQFKKAPAESNKDWADLVWIKDEFEENRWSRSQSLHQAGQCGSRSWSLLGQGTIHGTPYQHRRSCLLLPSLPP